ncbi:MAG: FG-GAP-like repeat-containing protein [Chitinophagaceae bacterium]
MKKLFYFQIILLASLQAGAQKPNITSFSPTSGTIGTTITITGTNFNATAAQNVVVFGATKATVTAASVTSLTVTVSAGATYQPITALNLASGLVGSSSQPFRVTFPGGSIATNSLDPKVDFAAGAGAISISNGDLDGDGKPDMAVANFTANTVSILRNTGSAGTITAGSFAAKFDLVAGTSPRFVSIGDLNGDGKPDLAIVNFGSNNVSIFRNTSSVENISFDAKVDFATGAGPRSVSIGDFDGDGKPDVTIANSSNNFMSVLRNTSSAGSISFQNKVDFALTGGNASTFVSSGDLDGDGKPDVVVANYALNTISVFRNTAATGIIDASSFATRVDFTTGTFPFSVNIGDLDGDGKADLAVANYYSDSISVFRNTTSIGMINAASFDAKVDFKTGVAPISSTMGDIDGDGKIDLVTTNYDDNTISILRNTATSGSITASSFAAKIDFATATGPRLAGIGDLDGDGKPDLAVATNVANTVSVLHNLYSIFAPVTANQAICANSTASLTASCATGTAHWYDAGSVGIPFVGSFFTTPTLTTNTTYKVRCEQGSNMSPFADVLVSVNPGPVAPVITASGPTTFCAGKSVTLNANIGINKALSFSQASSQYITVPHSAGISLGATFSMEAWVNFSGINRTILDKGDYDFLWQLGANGNAGKMGFYSRNTGSWSYATGTVPENTWTHVAITLSGGTLTFYINGVASGTAAVTFSADNQPMNIGRQQPTACACNYFNGSMDELRIWNVLRTQTNIQAAMNTTVPTNSAGLVAYYKFDEGVGNTSGDATGNGNNGTFVNGPTWQVPATSPVNRVVWSPGGATTPAITVSAAGAYTATVTNGFGRTNAATTMVTIIAQPALGPDVTVYKNCFGETTDLTTLFNTNGLTQSWNTPNPFAAPAGIYRLIANNNDGCTDTAFANIILEVATWTGTQSNDWNTPGNWNINKVPGTLTHVIIPGGTPNLCYINTAGAVAASIQVRTGGNVRTVNTKSVTVNGKCLVLPPN